MVPFRRGWTQLWAIVDLVWGDDGRGEVLDLNYPLLNFQSFPDSGNEWLKRVWKLELSLLDEYFERIRTEGQ
jgi:hypothetical protein